MKKIIRAGLDVLYPRRCPVCDGLLGKQEPLICRKCAEKLEFLKQPLCFRCGKPLEQKEREYCGDCRKIRHWYERGFAPFSYRGIMQQSVMRFKYGGRAEYAGFYAVAVLEYGRELLSRWRPEVLMPVPVHPARLARRGYNQAELLAQKLSELCGIPMESRAVLRMKNTKAQKNLSSMERKKNLENAFALVKSYKPPERILVIDDIYTTGSTIDGMAALLSKNGAKAVYFACITVSPGDSF